MFINRKGFAGHVMISVRNRLLVGLTEEIILNGKAGSMKVVARIDTGATNSAIDKKLAAELKLGPIKTTKIIRSTHGNSIRPVIEINFTIQDKDISALFTIADRTHMKYKALIGQNVLKRGFLIDPSKK